MAGDGFLIISLQSGSGEVLNMRRFISKATMFIGVRKRSLVLIFHFIITVVIISPWHTWHPMRCIMGGISKIKGEWKRIHRRKKRGYCRVIICPPNNLGGLSLFWANVSFKKKAVKSTAYLSATLLGAQVASQLSPILLVR